MPANVNRVRLSGNVVGGGSNFGIFCHRNGAIFYGTPNHDATGTADAVNIMSGIIPVLPGDQLSLMTFDASGMSITSDEGN